MLSSSQGQDSDVTSGMNIRAAARGILISMVVNMVPATIVFLLMKYLVHTTDIVSLIVSGLPVTLYSIIGSIRRRKIDFFSGVMLFIIVISIIFLLIGGNPKFYLLRMSLISLSIGLAYIVSLLFPKPLWFYIGRHFFTGNDPQNVANYDSQWQYPYFHRALRLMTLFWGIATLLCTAIQVMLVLMLSIAFFLAISPIVDGAMWLILFGWTGWFLPRMLKRLSALKESEKAQVNMVPS